jgi:hypothetical protein
LRFFHFFMTIFCFQCCKGRHFFVSLHHL